MSIYCLPHFHLFLSLSFDVRVQQIHFFEGELLISVEVCNFADKCEPTLAQQVSCLKLVLTHAYCLHLFLFFGRFQPEVEI